MRTFLITCIAAVISCSEVIAQGSYFNAGFGYGFSAGDRLGVTEPGGAEKNVYGSFGKGLTVGLNTGYMANDNVGFDLGLWYVMGSTYEFIFYQGSNGTRSHRFSGNTFRIMPEIKLTGGKTTRPYAKFGLILGITTAVTDDETIAAPTGTEYATHEFTGGTSHGWTGAFGIDFSGNQATSIFLEVNFCHQVYKADLETINIEGQDPQTFALVDEPNPNDPGEKLKPSFPFSTITITAGVKFSSFLKKKSPAPAEK